MIAIKILSIKLNYHNVNENLFSLLAKIYNFWQVCSFVGLLLAKIYNFWQVCSFVGLLLAKIYNFGKYVRLSVCLFVCPFCQA